MNRHDFPDDFKWGIATSATQIEGAAFEDGKGLNIWDVFSRIPGKIYNGETPDLACDYYHRYPEQLEVMKALGFNSHRFSFSWSRICPEGYGKINQKGVDFYRRVLDKMHELDLTPNATLYHWDLPYELECRGGFLNRDIVEWFGDYAEFMFETFKDDIPLWTTFNEPIATYVGYATGIFAPGRKGEKFGRQANHNLLLCHGEAVKRFRQVYGTRRLFSHQKANIGIVVDIWHHHPADPDSPADVAMAALENEKSYLSYLNPIFRGCYTNVLMDYLKDTDSIPETRFSDMALITSPIDFFGLNCYNRVVDSAEGNAREIVEHSGGNYMDNGQEFYPNAIYDALHILKDKYKLDIPIFITENGTFNCEEEVVKDENGNEAVHDVSRINYFKGCLEGLKRAIDEGIDVRGYYAWSLIDNYEWTAGSSSRFGLIHANPGISDGYILKDSAKYFARFLR